MTQTFKLKNGEISFENDKITISDDANKQKRSRLLSSSVWTIYGTLSVLRYLKTGDSFLLWTGLLIGMGHLLIVLLTLLRTTQSEIFLREVKSIKLNQKFSNKFLDIRLNSNRLRRVVRVENKTELEEYIETNFRN